MSAKNLLVELFVEELPPKALKKLGEVFAQTLAQSLKTQGLAPEAAAVTAYASPRRLAAHVTDVLAVAADKPVVQKLMPVAVGLDAAGNATPALLKKLAALGADASVVPSLRRENDGKAEVLFYDSLAKGAALAEGLQKALEAALAALPIPKVMSYQLQDGWTSVNFVRPAHRLVALHGSEVVPLAILGLTSGNTTLGHRFEAAKEVVTFADADSYADTLKRDGAVIANYEERSEEIIRQLLAKARELGCWLEVEPAFADGRRIDLTPEETKQQLLDDKLVQEVTALVERPNVLIGKFEAEFLAVPQECLILTMKANQKYFPLLDASGKLTNQFLVVSNIAPADPSAVIGGNERVVRPRLADAKFFFDQDRKKSLADRIPALTKVVYHNKLGTQGERTQRVCAIASAIGRQLGGEDLARQADQAALLAKADLLTDMVGEFPELQGIMGRYYALHDGLSADIADAIEDHYKPRFAGDSLPRGNVGTVVALADKLETLVGLFGIGQIPTGDKDPFALRRHALGVIRMLAEGDLALELNEVLEVARAAFGSLVLTSGIEPSQAPKGSHGKGSIGTPFDGNVSSLVADFIYDRLAGSLREQGYSAQEVDAVVSQRPQRLGDIPKRLAAVRAFAALPEAEALAAANKRVGNILKKVEGGVAAKIDSALLQEAAEVALAQALAEVKPAADAAFAKGDYAASLQSLAALKAPVDTFFNDVMVNAEDPALRANRLGLLATLHLAMNQVADISKLSA
ncbi:glycyl-tRNA synthetase, tetrameric type, beta subunit [Azospira oryzae PS]|uniref:Glycine--tRNA ligase beta subunit n=1 Tax=Azospira oryzae (strain ATCC BAA-33 / DSM 13638 / PS) TaxID=640081 RepID=G8QLL1_AZOOP|nr:glycine--tRNA ligase subunit beta [Azospira oryzae]AEV25601.1 glycyl-tRNA synthetase, tetrameric type, beta subunit [Azospira oryzae PS]